MIVRTTLALMLLSTPPALAQMSLSIPLDADTQTATTSYSCGDEPFAVHYLTGPDNALALLPVDGTRRIFVNVVSASGARYVSGPWEWWSKGDTATLTNLVTRMAPRPCSAIPDSSDQG